MEAGPGRQSPAQTLSSDNKKQIQAEETDMNIYQRIILVLGAAALIIAIQTSPQVLIVQGAHVKPSVDTSAQFQPMISAETASMRAVGVIGATVLLFFALKGEIKKRPKKAKAKK
jgi:hypothetical protein